MGLKIKVICVIIVRKKQFKLKTRKVIGMNLSYKQALWAAYTMLDVLYDEQDCENLRFILSEMSPFTFKDRICADPALWESWLECSKNVNNSGSLEFEQVMPTLIDFLKANEAEYSCFEKDGGSYSTDDISKKLLLYVENGYWDSLLNRVVNYSNSVK